HSRGCDRASEGASPESGLLLAAATAARETAVPCRCRGRKQPPCRWPGVAPLGRTPGYSSVPLPRHQTAAEPTAPPSVALATTPAFRSHDWTGFSGSLYLVGSQGRKYPVGSAPTACRDSGTGR